MKIEKPTREKARASKWMKRAITVMSILVCGIAVTVLKSTIKE